MHISLSPYAGHYCVFHGEAARRADALDQPLVAEIVVVGPNETHEGVNGIVFTTTRVTLNVGGQHGVLSGLSLELVDPAFPDTLVEVVEAHKQTAEARIIEFKRTEKEIETPSVGWKLSTRK